MYKDLANVEEVNKKYSDKYPLTFVQLDNGGIQILVGPLNSDEYSIILARFKEFG